MLKGIFTSIVTIFTVTAVNAQISIKGNVYGGGNAGDLGGRTHVTVSAGNIDGNVFAGARQANVGGSAFVHIDGEHQTGDILINYVYGGNDISGTIGASHYLPKELRDTTRNNIDNTRNAFVLTTAERKDTTQIAGKDSITQPYHIYLGTVFGGGNGDYTYTSGSDGYLAKNGDDTIAVSQTPFVMPEVGKAYLEIRGGSIVIAYGGGNNVTVTQATDICIDNPSAISTEIKDSLGNNILEDDGRLRRMGVYQLGGAGENTVTSDAYQFSRVFGGNNKAAMAIRPTWHLRKGKIRNLYSGGNKGNMIYEKAIFLLVASDDLEINNVYGGCRMADVNPDRRPMYMETVNGMEGVEGGVVVLPKDYAAAVSIFAGKVNNVYGGNDVSGTVYGGSAVGIHNDVIGDVYGGGNGSYPYTDDAHMENTPLYGDFYYNPDSVLAKAGIAAPADPGMKSALALNEVRPHAEATTVRLLGHDTPTIVGGSVYCGGNSATLRSPDREMRAELKIGSNVYIDKVFLGSNGANMIDTTLLKQYKDSVFLYGENHKFSKINLNDPEQFAVYMQGCELGIKPRVVFDSRANGETQDYDPYSSYFGSFFCGGNIGSVNTEGEYVLNFNFPVIIFDKLVGGSNNAYVPETKYNARYEGGVLGDPDPDTGNKIVFNLSGLRLQPKRWKDPNDRTKLLEWNTIDSRTYNPITDTYSEMPNVTPEVLSTPVESSEDDLSRRLIGGNVYGGCYNSGHVNGNVVVNLNSTIVDRYGEYGVFDSVVENEFGEASQYLDNLLEQSIFHITERRTGVILGQQGMDVLGSALNVFGGGYGKESTIWGSTTVNLNRGFCFQIFGGGERGPVGKSDPSGTYEFNGKTYKYNPDYSCTVNLRGKNKGVTIAADHSEDMAECEFIYGGGFIAPVAGNTVINLGNGRVFNTFGGACNADILGHAETYMGRQLNDDGTFGDGFPFVRDIIYGGNDLGGRIFGKDTFMVRVRDEVKDMVYQSSDVDFTEASAYVEYTQGRAEAIFGGCFGTYDYKDPKFKDYTYTTGDTDATEENLGTARPGFTKPRMESAFVNFRPTLTDVLKNDTTNRVKIIYGSGQGYPDDSDRDIMQDRSYVLVDIPQEMENFKKMDVFGSGAWCGLGMLKTQAQAKAHPDSVTAVVDLLRGQINYAHGASLTEGFTRRTILNVPDSSTIRLNKIFGGGKGEISEYVCDAYEANVEYHGKNACVGAIYGGNNNSRRVMYGKVNIDVPVYTGAVGKDGTRYMATVYGAGFGLGTWSQYTEVNLLDGAEVYEVYGGGEEGRVANKVTTYRRAKDFYNENYSLLAIGGDYTDDGLDNDLAIARHDGKKYNTNVIIHKGATVHNYAYGGGKGLAGPDKSGDVNGTTYISLLGGTVKKDLYAAGTVGNVLDDFGDLTDDFGNHFRAGTTAFIAGGTLRNVYGGGWQGDVGNHEGEEYEAGPDDIFGETNVIIGIRKDQPQDTLLAQLSYVKGSQATLSDYGYYNGVPAVQRNAYGGGEGQGTEGGAVYGTANLTLNNGYIGYVYTVPDSSAVGEYQEKIDDETWTDGVGAGRLKDCGNMFGGGYSDKSGVDSSMVVMYGGIVRNSVHGGGEIATVGRGTVTENGSLRTLNAINKFGKTRVELFNGHVMRNVFGGGKGYNILGYGGENGLYTDGYVFGQTEVHIHGGEVGTEEDMNDEHKYGNVFGGGDIGFVYSKGYFNQKTQQNINTGSPNHHYYYYNDGNGDNLVEDCKVVVAPYLQVKPGKSVTFEGVTYGPYDYVPTDYLNTLPKKTKSTGHFEGGWLDLYDTEIDGTGERGITIRNAVFAGGNVTSNSDVTYANATTVFGNTTATLYDVFHRDFISVGTEHVGGIYGGGNLSMVDGYRELNITNYGTDYYGLESQITLDDYRNLSNRERAYFQLQYVCNETFQYEGVTYEKDRIYKEEEYLKLIGKNPSAKDNFTPYGFCSIYAGRLLNTIQRADLCGVYGSRIVLMGAKDRVAEVAEDINYTINRVGELSLNQKRSVAGDDPNGNDYHHGNYFGIYSIVNYMGNLTSDIRFTDPWIDGTGNEHQDKTFYTYKFANPKSSSRNNGTSFNQLALASGVYLELTTENSTPDHKDYGYVTGIIELDLINVKKDVVGGGFVYAKNEHRVGRYYPNEPNIILSEYNKKVGDEAVSYKHYRYSADQPGIWAEDGTAYNTSGSEDDHDINNDPNLYQEMVIETSGNFIHPKKRIVDDCYPINNAYISENTPYSEAHYWYIKGDVYIYDQKVSAYTGSASAYSKEVHLPLTITAASFGKLQLLNVKPNLYAYYAPTSNNGIDKAKIGTFKDGNGKDVDKVFVNNDADSYELNDVITWWDWHQLSATERSYFVEQTYVNCITCTIDGEEYEPGTYVLSEADLNRFKSQSHTILNASGDATTVDFVFRSSNNIAHDTGYVLTVDMDSPRIWDDYYTLINNDSSAQLTKEQYNQLSATEKLDYREGPTFTPQTSGVYGQRQYEVGEIITKETYDNNAAGSGDQATMEQAYVATEQVTYTYGGVTKTANAGTAIPETEYNAIGSAQSSFAPAYTCTFTQKLAGDKYLLYGELKTRSEIDQLKTDYPALAEDIENAMSQAYICSEAGAFGGQQFNTGNNYSAIQAWCSLSRDDRIAQDGTYKFIYNYDALNLLSDKDYLVVGESIESPSHERTEQAYGSPYSDWVAVDYEASFNMDESKTVEFNDGSTRTFTKGAPGSRLSNSEYETVRNDQLHYTRVSVAAGGETIYIATSHFIYDGTPYAKGQVLDEDIATAPINASHVEAVNFTNTLPNAVILYYCYEDYPYDNKGHIIDETTYAGLTNHQKYFLVQGQEPTETTTFYVSRESDIYDLSKERIYTVVYQYTYYEDEDDGSVTLTNELHVINVHLMMESGAPQIGVLNPPSIVLPGDAVGLKAPEVKPGLYEILTSGWELFDNIEDAEKHRNGVPFTNNSTPVYWYQNQKNYVAFYSKTYLGKTYSNPVPLSVANYHDIDKVMQDKEHHMYVDNERVDRDSKIYIDDRACLSDSTKSEIDLLKDFFDLSVAADSINHHAPLGNHVRACRNLEFFLRSDVSPKAYTTWTPIGNNNTQGDAGQCFDGVLHGDGHSINGLSNSLFAHLCGDVYNLGVTGSFTTAGIADTGYGYLENCWVKTSGTPASGVRAVFNDPSDNKGSQLVNCYYPVSNAYSETSNARGNARKMPDRAFYNGEVTYDLNGFYLNKRYFDHTTVSGTTVQYEYLPMQADTLPKEMSTAYYPRDTYAYYPKNTSVTPYLGYVEWRFADGDYRYAAGKIPDNNDIRMRIVGEDQEAVTKFVPIWPDDYLFFGQMLTYGYVNEREHQELPAVINRQDGILPKDDTANRVYRAPAYFRSKTMDVAHFNPNAVFAKTKMGDETVLAYKDMTAIDFTGGNGDVAGGYKSGIQATGFFTPLLDDGGLTSMLNVNLTKNLLVYTEAPGVTTAGKTGAVVSTYLSDEECVETDANYRTVDKWNSYSGTVNGHWVMKSGNAYIATRDHMLVDKNDFNAPMAYTFGEDYRMWYQRQPDNFVDRVKGWEGISLPFEVELVTTQDKGELTHFFEGSTKGHEYWLRHFTGTAATDDANVLKATMNYPASNNSNSKEYNNTFLWDYYYSYSAQRDRNEDIYKEYYRTGRTISSYPLQQPAVPYIVGFPGRTYYEFDLSGTFIPANTFERISQLEPQMVTFASTPGVTIRVSDDEIQGVTNGGYTFMPSYMNDTIKANTNAYTLAADGGSYDLVTAGDVVVEPFRPFFVKATGGGAGAKQRIIFSQLDSEMQGVIENEPAGIDQTGGLTIATKRRTIIVSSTLSEDKVVNIFTVGGQAVSTFTIKSGETIETPVQSGVFIVNGKKVVVR